MRQKPCQRNRLRARTEHDKFIRDVRHKKHAGRHSRVWHKCPWCSLKFTGQQWLSHEYMCPSRPPRPPPEQIVDFGRVKKRVWGKPPIKWHKCPFCKNKFTGRQWLAHTCKERNMKERGCLWITPTTAAVMSTQNHELPRPQTQPLDPVLSRLAGRPLGLADCKRHSLPGKCSKCGLP
jgi:hypothetical protein